ncbi:MAG TPA: type I methionyl aminopeptidase [Spirochaetia bacterium]|nr:type I methionyl aminopeptidase [Spirochaetia bacterium]
MIRLKSESDIDKIRASCNILSETYTEIVKLIEPEISLIEIDAFTRDFIRKRGGKPAFLGYQGYPASICISVNSVVIHGIPDKNKLKEGDIVSLDLGVDLGGYISDAACTVPVGRISREAQTLLDVTSKCLSLGVAQARAGNRIKDISAAVYEHASSFGFGIVRQFCGHGVGFSLHEDPQIPNYVGPGPNPRLKSGMVLAIEPMINLGGDDVEILEDGWTVETTDHSLSAHFEHTVAVFKDHTEILTALP